MIPAFVNPAAGSAHEVHDALRRHGAFDVIEVPADQVTQDVRAAVAAGATRVVAAGGDGTISAVAAAVARTATELAIVPGGTLNHFARDHGIPTDLAEACSVAAAGRVVTADVAWVNGRLFLNTSSVGLYAKFVRVRERMEPRWGYRISSLLAVLRTFWGVRPFRVAFETSKMERDYITPLVFVGVGERELKLPKLGGRVAEGRSGLHVLIVRGRTRARLVALAFAAASRGSWATSRTPHLDGFVVDHCIIEQRHSTVAVDGEVVILESPLHYEIGRRALRLVVP